MLHYETIEPRTLELLKQLQSLPALQNCRLVGGTALALQLGHRKSIDLDLFGQFDIDPLEMEEMLRAESQPMPIMFADITWTQVKEQILQAVDTINIQ